MICLNVCVCLSIHFSKNRLNYAPITSLKGDLPVTSNDSFFSRFLVMTHVININVKDIVWATGCKGNEAKEYCCNLVG